MDFLDYQTYAIDDGLQSDEQLPEPASRLTIKTEHSSTSLDQTFQLPEITETSTDEEPASLQNKMKRYASLSLSQLSLSDARSHSKSAISSSVKGSLPREDSLQQLLQSREKAADNADSLLSKKLSRVLDTYHRNSSQADMNLRKSLQVLEENQGCLNFNGQTLVRPDFLGSLARNSLRSSLENEILRSHLSILEDIQPIVRRIKRLTEPIQAISEIGESILKDGIQKSEEPQGYMQKAHEIRDKLRKLRLQRELLAAIRDKLTLTQLEEDALTNAPIGSEFFQVVNKTMQIKETSSYLLALPNPQAGKNLLEQSNLKIEKANRRIFNYLVDFLHDLQSASKTFGEREFASDDGPLVTFQESMVYLSNDLPLFNEFLQRVVKLRSRKILDDFLSQFDVDCSKTSKPIMISAHDPVRYLGDVLAHVHSLIVDEADFMNSMFKFRDVNIAGAPKSILQKNSEFLSGLSTSLWNETFGPIENSIRIRLEQIIRFEDDPIINFDISELLKLYQVMFIKYGILPESNLIKQLVTLRATASSKIVTGLLKSLDNLYAEEVIDSELLPAEWLSRYMNQVCEFLTKLEKSGSLTSPDCLLQSNFMDQVIGCLVTEKLPQYHQKKFPTAKKDKNAKALSLISEVNCYDLIQTRLLPYEQLIFERSDSKPTYEKVKQQLELTIKSLIEVETKAIFEKLGLNLYSSLFNMIFPIESVQDELDYDMYLPVIENPIMKRETIKVNVHGKLNDSLPFLLSDVQDNIIFHVVSPKIADRLLAACFHELSKFYSIFRSVLFRLYPDDAEEISTILNFSDQEFNTLIGLD